MPKKTPPPPPPEPKKRGFLARRFLEEPLTTQQKRQGKSKTHGPAEDPKAQAKRTNHQSFQLESGPGSRRVGFVNCRCSEFDSDHLR